MRVAALEMNCMTCRDYTIWPGDLLASCRSEFGGKGDCYKEKTQLRHEGRWPYYRKQSYDVWKAEISLMKHEECGDIHAPFKDCMGYRVDIRTVGWYLLEAAEAWENKIRKPAQPGEGMYACDKCGAWHTRYWNCETKTFQKETQSGEQ